MKIGPKDYVFLILLVSALPGCKTLGVLDKDGDDHPLEFVSPIGEEMFCKGYTYAVVWKGGAATPFEALALTGPRGEEESVVLAEIGPTDNDGVEPFKIPLDVAPDHRYRFAITGEKPGGGRGTLYSPYFKIGDCQ